MAWSTWGDAYTSYLARDYDHGYAAYRADEWQKRSEARKKSMEATDWQLIETAPKDGTRVLLFCPPYGAGSGHYDHGWWLHFCLSKDHCPTHWMFLPEPPNEMEPGT